LDKSSNSVQSAFVIRLSRDLTNGGWRGQIVHLQSNATRYFTTFAQIREFISQFAPGLDVPSADSTEGSASK
jgi:hypothetical protein